MLFVDRRDAGRRLAQELRRRLLPDERAIVLGLPRGGVPVAHEIAQALGIPLDVLIVRKLGVPGHEELAMGAISSGGVRTLNQDVVRWLGISAAMVESVAEREAKELARRERAYRGDRAPLDLRGRTVIVVDDGLATGASMRAALETVAQLDPKRVIAAVPVAPAETCAALAEAADEVVCATTPEPFQGVGRWYESFEQTTDEEVKAILARTAPPRAEVAHG